MHYFVTGATGFIGRRLVKALLARRGSTVYFQIYLDVPTLGPEEAADMIAQACVDKPVRIATRLGVFGQTLRALVPRIAQIMMNTSFRMFPDSDAAQGAKGEKPRLSQEAIALQQMMRGIHF